MTRYVKCDDVTCDYLTSGKVYQVIQSEDYDDPDLGLIKSDDGEDTLLRFSQSAHINFKPWTFCDAEGNPV